jgi:WD40 repeat protein
MEFAPTETLAASTDFKVMVQTHPTSTTVKTIIHTSAVRSILPLPLSHLDVSYLITGAGEVLSTYDISTIDERGGVSELLSINDVHSHDITALGLWIKDVEVSKVIRQEPWIVSGSLDGTLRRWRLAGM